MIKQPITVYAPNLVQRPERKASIIEQFRNRSEFDLHVVPAIELKQPTWGLWQTFYKIVEQESKKESDFFIFCEDDHVFTEAYSKDLLFQCIEQAETLGADILSGGMAVTQTPIQVARNMFWVSWFNGMQFTIVFRRAYNTILAAKTTDGYTLDVMLSHLLKNKFVIYPYISIQKEFGYSDATTINNEAGRVTRFFEKSQSSLGKLKQVQRFYGRLSQTEADAIMSMNVAGYSIPVYAINMKSRKDRLTHIKHEFEGRQEFELNIIEACEDNNGAVGLWKSICKIIEIAKAAEEDFIIICEDDHSFSPTYDSTLFLRQVMLAGAMKADMLNAGVGGFGNLVPLKNGIYWVDNFWCTQFIVIYKRAYDTILNAPFGERDVADEKLSAILTMKMVIAPFISEQKDFGYSDVTSSNNEHATILRHFDEAKQKLEHYEYVRKMLCNEISHADTACSITEYLKHDGLHKMQIGCGNNLVDGWLNTDLQPTYGATFLDAMQRFPMPDACMDVVFAEHLIEEYPVQKLDGMFQEINRVLRPNGTFRLTFFTSDHMLKMMNGSTSEDVYAEYVNWTLRNHGNEKMVLSMSNEAQRSMAYTIFLRRMSNIMLYGYATIQELLLRNGFSKVSSYKLGVSNNDALRHVEMHKAYCPQTIYQFEVVTIEAVKRA